MSEISRIKLQNNEVYNLKDELLRHQLAVLLGQEKSEQEKTKVQKTSKDIGIGSI